jgi:acyl carrier protein
MEKNIREIVLLEIRKIGEEQAKKLAPLTDDLNLMDSGLDSLGFAILVTRLEDSLGLDPFTSADEAHYPETLGDLINLYEHASARI